MARLPVIVGFGGVNAAGRSSFHHGFNRMVLDSLPDRAARQSLQALASMMQLPAEDELSSDTIEHIRLNTLIRKIHSARFDTANVPWNRRVNLRPEPEQPIFFDLRTKHLPSQIPEGWELTHVDERTVQVVIRGACEMMLPDTRQADVSAAGQLPTGFDPEALYQARNHPRGLQMTVYGASDALRSTGLEWDLIRQKVAPDKISVYAGSAMSQLDALGTGGMMSSRGFGKRVTSKQCALGFAEMPADFINAYILGSVGTTGTAMGACASFLYNLRMGVQDIQSGRSRVAVVGNSEAPITSEVMEGYAAMGALASDKELLRLEGKSEFEQPDFSRACRPFSSNCGFTIAESAQFIVLFDDELALELGAMMYGAVDNVFVNADGNKKSISAPGIGNYITVAKALGSMRNILGEQAVQRRSFVHAHGTGTPQNRTTESDVLNECAKAFGIESWPVAAIKCFVGHSIGVAAGDQLAATLGTWATGIVPGIRTIDHVADDVNNSNLSISAEHQQHEVGNFDAALINAKGFGGNNASASVLAPHIAMQMLEKKHGKAALANYQRLNEPVAESAEQYDAAASKGSIHPIYMFDHNVLAGESLKFDNSKLFIEGYDAIDLEGESIYKDML